MDLTRPVDQATAQALREAFWTHKVLVFRVQHLSPVHHGRGATSPVVEFRPAVLGIPYVC